ncbi:hypothetical protein [Yonghaparkia sp. Soil809]|uniref:hypothetical protein n=1 Tax=Yonghaparkia sp. Soil809 TaxID=1736417 RepID=UPI0006FC2C02|nr:hypothetical protein [Yonghaparkia sp. Soil809]KRF33377.1 hypothetical protein ASG83_05420 [Yonghaparkia sp. Soil809]
MTLTTASLVVAAPAAAVTFGPVSDLAGLQQAIADANANPGADVITVAPTATIVGAGGAVTVDSNLVIDLDGATVDDLRVFVVGAELTLQDGTWTALPDANATLVAPGFGVGATASLTLQSMTVTATGSECDAAIGGWFTAAGQPTQCNSGTTAASGAITIVDSTVTATGGSFGAGIGGGSRGDQGSVTITSSTVTATGGYGAAGIGGGKDRPGGSVELTDSTVTATGGIGGAAGIGGGEYSAGGSVVIDGGVIIANGTSRGAGIGGGGEFGVGGTTTITGDAIVTATGATFSSGIGGSYQGRGGTTNIGGTAVVTAIGRDGGPGIGSSYTSAASGPTTITDGTPTLITASIQGSFAVASSAAVTLAPTGTMVLDGASSNAGAITVNAPSQLEIPSGDTFTNAQAIAGTGTLRGGGTIDNTGVICANVGTDLIVTGTAFLLEYALPGGGTEPLSVYATSLTAGCRELLDISTSEQVLLGWTIGVDGPYLTTLTDLEAEVPSGSATLEPVLADAVLTFTPASTLSTAGETVQVQAFGPMPMSMTPSTDLTEFLLLGGDIALGAVGGEFVSTTAGEQTITGTLGFTTESGEIVLSGSFTHTTLSAPLDEIALEASALTVDQGRSVTLQVDGQDAYGNAIEIDPADVVVTSSVPTDVIDGLTVTFPTASPHVLTVTVGDVSAQVTIEVTPAAVIPVIPVDPEDPTIPAVPELSATGGTDVTSGIGLAALLLVLGVALVLVRRRLA